MTLKQIGERYKLQWGDYEFWASYWINWPGVTASPLKGKARPEELQNAVSKAFGADPFPPETPDEARFQMLRNALGIDCSGFVYHTLNTFLAQNGVTLANYLYVPKKDVLEAISKDSWKKAYQPSRQEIVEWPQNIPLSYLTDTFNKKPEHLIDVARLCNSEAAAEVNGDPSVGDMVYIIGKFGDHIQLITEVDGDRIEVMSSRYEALAPGGVTVESLDRSTLKESGTIWRLKCMSKGRVVSG